MQQAARTPRPATLLPLPAWLTRLALLGMLGLCSAPARGDWTQQYFVPNQGNAFLSVAAGSADQVAAIGIQSDGMGGGGGIAVYTADGGRTWRNAVLPQPANQFDFRFPTALTFLSPTRAVMGVTGFFLRLYVSENGGASWQELPDQGLGGGAIGQFCSRGPDRVWATAGDRILRSTDRGATWQAAALPDLGERQLSGIFFLTEELGWAVGGEAAEYSEDQGMGRELLSPPRNGLVLVSGDGGATWQPAAELASASFDRVAFLDQTHGWIAGSGEEGALLFSTEDGGGTLAPVPLPAAEGQPLRNWAALALFPDGRSFAVGSAGAPGAETLSPVVLTSQDQGASWTPDPTLAESLELFARGSALLDATFPSSARGWVAGQNLLVARWTEPGSEGEGEGLEGEGEGQEGEGEGVEGEGEGAEPTCLRLSLQDSHAERPGAVTVTFDAESCQGQPVTNLHCRADDVAGCDFLIKENNALQSNHVIGLRLVDRQGHRYTLRYCTRQRAGLVAAAVELVDRTGSASFRFNATGFASGCDPATFGPGEGEPEPEGSAEGEGEGAVPGEGENEGSGADDEGAPDDPEGTPADEGEEEGSAAEEAEESGDGGNRPGRGGCTLAAAASARFKDGLLLLLCCGGWLGLRRARSQNKP